MRFGLIFLSVGALAACVAADPPPPMVDPAPAAVEPAREPPVPGRQYRQRILQGPGQLQVRGYLQDVISDRFGPGAWSDFNSAATAVAAASLPGRWASSHEPRVSLLIRTNAGWRRQGGGVSRELTSQLDSALADRALWGEPDRHPEIPCPDAGADVLMIRYSGRTKTVYQSGGCGPPNLSTRLIQAALEAGSI